MGGGEFSESQNNFFVSKNNHRQKTIARLGKLGKAAQHHVEDPGSSPQK